MEDTNNNNQDNFSFDEFISHESAKELGIETATAAQDVTVDSSPTKVEKPQEVVTEVKNEVAPVEKVSEVEITTEPEQSGPVRAPNEPDWKYEYRKEIWDKQQAIKNSSSDEEKSALLTEIKELRKEVAQTSKQKEQEDIFDAEAPEGFVRKDEVIKIIQEREQAARLDALETNFINSKPNLKDPSTYDMFMQYVGSVYNIVGKNEQQLLGILNLAYEDMFPNTSKAKIADAEKLTKALDAVDFSGSQTPTKGDPEKEEDAHLVESIKGTSGNDFSWIL